MVIIFFSTNAHKAQEISQILRNCEVRLYSEFVEKFSVEENGATFAQNAKIKLFGLKARLEKSGFDVRQFGGKRVILMAEDSGICVEALNGRPGIYSARYALNSSLRVDSQNLGENILSLRNFAKQSCGNPPIKKIQNLQSGLPREQSSLAMTENNNFAESSADSANIAQIITELNSLNIAESSAQFISCVACCDISQNLKATANALRGSIFDEKSGLCSCERGNRTNGSLTKRATNLPDLSQKDNRAILTTHGFLNGKVITQIRGNNGFGYDPIFVPNGFSQTLGELDKDAKNALSHRANALKLMALLLK